MEGIEHDAGACPDCQAGCCTISGIGCCRWKCPQCGRRCGGVLGHRLDMRSPTGHQCPVHFRPFECPRCGNDTLKMFRGVVEGDGYSWVCEKCGWSDR